MGTDKHKHKKETCSYSCDCAQEPNKTVHVYFTCISQEETMQNLTNMTCGLKK